MMGGYEMMANVSTVSRDMVVVVTLWLTLMCQRQAEHTAGNSGC